MEASPADRSTGGEAISHSDRLALVDRGQIVGFFESSDQDALDALVARASRLALPRWVRMLAHRQRESERSLRRLAARGLVPGPPSPRPQRGWIGPNRRSHRSVALIDRPVVRAHATCMLLAVATSTLFLVSYLVYHSQAGSMPFRHGGAFRVIYFTILLSHTVLATFGVVPLVVLTLTRALRHDFAKHVPIAQVTFPIWLYVSITGVVIYLMLYGLPLSVSGGYRLS